MERKMFFEASPDIFKYAHWLRRHMTESELILWKRLRNNNLGVRFKAQHPMLYYIADFYCYALKLVIEIDGPIHKFKYAEDKIRTQNIEGAGNIVIRFTNEEVLENIEKVITDIRNKIAEISNENSKKTNEKTPVLNTEVIEVESVTWTIPKKRNAD